MNNFKTFIVLLLLLLSFKSVAQPSPCMGQNLVIIENISGLGKDTVSEIYFAHIRYWDPEYPKMQGIKPKWMECFLNDSLVTDRLYLFSGSNSSCINGEVTSRTSGRHYLIGYDLNNAVLVIKSGQKTMYIVMPDLSNQSVNAMYSEFTVRELQKQNIQLDTKPFYTPYLFLPTIEFTEGVHFLSDFTDQQTVKRFSTNDIIEFYEIAGGTNRVSPAEYWNDEIGIYAPYGNTKVTYRSTFFGATNEKDAIRQIILNSPQAVREILNYAYWYKYIHKGASEQCDKELKQIWDNTKKLSTQRYEELSNSYKEGLISKEDFLTEWEAFASSHLQLVLEQDYALAISFIDFMLHQKEQLTDFQLIFEKETFKLDKVRFKEFLDTQQIEK